MRELIDEEELCFLEKEYWRAKSGGRCPAWDLGYVALACEAVPKLIDEDVFLREAVNTEIDRNESLSFTLFSKIKENDQLQKMIDWLADRLSESTEYGKKWIGALDETEHRYPLFSTKEQATRDWIAAARKASENEA